MKTVFMAIAILFAVQASKAQNINFINTTSCNVWADFYCRTPGCGVGVSTGGTVIPSGTITFNATTLNGGTPLPAGSAWKYGRIGDDAANCTAQAPGGGCTRNFYLTISDGQCVPGVTSGCFNADLSSTCNTCGMAQISVKTTYYVNGDLDVYIY